MMRRVAILAALALATPVLADGPWAGPDAEGDIRARRGQPPSVTVDPTPKVDPNSLVIIPGEAAKMEKGAFLGLTASPPNATLREQLKLPRGTGLVVDFVEKDSPADAAGLKSHDILTKLDDQILVNFQQLAVLVRLHKAGDAVKLTYLRQGEAKTADAKLIEKDVPVLRDETPWMMPVPGQGTLPPGMFERLPQGDAWKSAARVHIETLPDGSSVRSLKAGERTLTLTVSKDGKKTLVIDEGEKKGVFSGAVDTDEQRKALPAGTEEQLRRLESHRVPNLELKDGAEGPDISAPKGAVVSVSSGDSEHSLQLNIDAKGDKHLEVKDASGIVLFDGPINTPADRAKVPPAAIKKLERLEASVKWK